jgi:hypothetical protein
MHAHATASMLLLLLLVLSAAHLGPYLALLQCCGGNSARGNKRLTYSESISYPLERALQPHARPHPASPRAAALGDSHTTTLAGGGGTLLAR